MVAIAIGQLRLALRSWRARRPTTIIPKRQSNFYPTFPSTNPPAASGPMNGARHI